MQLKITVLFIQPNPTHVLENATQPNPTHGWTQPMSISEAGPEPEPEAGYSTASRRGSSRTRNAMLLLGNKLGSGVI